MVAVGRLAAVVRGVDVAVAVDVATIDVAVGVGAVGVDVAVAVANIASSGETVRSVGARLAADGAAVTVDGLAVDAGAGGLCHGGFRNSGSRGVELFPTYGGRGVEAVVETVPGVMEEGIGSNVKGSIL